MWSRLVFGRNSVHLVEFLILIRGWRINFDEITHRTPDEVCSHVIRCIFRLLENEGIETRLSKFWRVLVAYPCVAHPRDDLLAVF